MLRRTQRIGLSVGAAATLVVAALLVPQAAHADTSETAPETVQSVMPMEVAYYDEEVAAAHGFQLVTDENGETRSIPVTDGARALLADGSTSPEGTVTPFDTVVGNCGQSWLNGSKGANDVVSFTTGYSVRAAVTGHQWRVSAVGAITSGERNYAQGAGPAVWSTSGTTTAIGPGWAIVPPLSPFGMVTLVDGSVCYSGGPSFWFG